MHEQRTVSQSQVVMSQVMSPADANVMGNVHGGVIMKMVDSAAGVAAVKHCRGRVVTAHVDSMSFLSPVKVGDLVTVKSSVNEVGRTSMEVGARVEAEDLATGEVRHVSTAYLVMVALGRDDKPTVVPPLVAENATQERRMQEARVRREYRQREKEVIRASRRALRSDLETGRPTGTVQVIGHRGAMGHTPENTIPSFDVALAMGVDLIELDVHLSRDGELVVIHDPTVDRTTNGTGLVKDLTVEQLRQLDAGAWFDPKFAGARIPTLVEVLTWARGRTRVAIEIKNGPVYYPDIAEKLVACLRDQQMIGDVVLISFDHQVVRRVKDLEPALRTGILYVSRVVDPVSLAAQSGAEVLMPQAGFVTPDLIHAAHAADLRVFTWVVNEPEQMRQLIALGVDGMGSNYPDRLRALVARG